MKILGESNRIHKTVLSEGVRTLIKCTDKTLQNYINQGVEQGLWNWDDRKGYYYWRSLKKVLTKMGVTREEILSPIVEVTEDNLRGTKEKTSYTNFMATIWKFVARSVNGLSDKRGGYYRKKLPNGDIEERLKRTTGNLEETKGIGQ